MTVRRSGGTGTTDDGATPAVRALVDRCRGQSHVVGAVLLLGLTTVALGGLTATVGTIVEDHTAETDATRVASDFQRTFRPVETTGPRHGRVTFGDGRLSVEERQIRVLHDGTVRETVEADALVFEAEDSRTSAVAGAIVRGHGGSAWLERPPPVTVGPDVVVVGAPRLGASGSVAGSGGVTVPIRTNVSHDRTALGRGEFGVAIETRTPGPFRRWATDRNATLRVADLDGDGVPSAVIEFPGSREGFLVVHDVNAEVGHG